MSLAPTFWRNYTAYDHLGDLHAVCYAVSRTARWCSGAAWEPAPVRYDFPAASWLPYCRRAETLGRDCILRCGRDCAKRWDTRWHWAFRRSIANSGGTGADDALAARRGARGGFAVVTSTWMPPRTPTLPPACAKLSFDIAIAEAGDLYERDRQATGTEGVTPHRLQLMDTGPILEAVDRDANWPTGRARTASAWALTWAAGWAWYQAHERSRSQQPVEQFARNYAPAGFTVTVEPGRSINGSRANDH